MEKKKYYTNENESKELISSGLPEHTADGWFKSNGGFETEKSNNSVCKSWTTGNLLELLPSCIVVNGDEYTLKHTKTCVPVDDETTIIEECVTYCSSYAKLSGDFIGYSTIVDKCSFLECLVKLVCWVYSKYPYYAKTLK